MPTVTLPEWLMELGRRQTWLRVFTYMLFISCSFSIAGIEAAIHGLYLVILYHRLREPVAESLPWWIVASFALLPAIALLSALANGFEAPFQGGIAAPFQGGADAPFQGGADAPFQGDDTAPHLTENLQNLRGFFRLLLPLALLPALGMVNRRRLLLTLLFFSALMAVYASIQFLWGVDWFRPEGAKLITPYYSAEGVFQGVFHGKGNFSHHLTFAGFMLMLVPLFAALAWHHPGRMRWVWGAGALLSAVGVLASMGRSGWVGVAVGLLLLLLRFPRRILIPLATLVLLLGLVWALIGSGWLKARFYSPGQPALVKRFLSISLGENRERLYLWESALMGIRDRPFLGVGYGNDAYYAPAYRTEIAGRRRYTFKISLDTHMHNIYLQLGFELGLLGLAAYLLWWGAVFSWIRISLQRAGKRFPFERGLLLGAAGGMAGTMAAGFFENNFFDAEVQTLILILMGLSLHAGMIIRHGQETGPGDRARKQGR